jgi:DNA modification methylase
MAADACGGDWQGPQESQGGAVSEAGDAMLLQANARRIPLASGSVHCCACSPPYFGLRSYLDQDDPNKALEIGLEPTPAEFVEALRVVGKEVFRVLRDNGSWWLNLGDSYCNTSSRNNGSGLDGRRRGGMTDTDGTWNDSIQSYGDKRYKLNHLGIKHKDLCLIPERVALALQADGWYVRSKPVWVKTNCMPESTRDRPNVAHESIFLLTKQARYYFDMEAVRVPSAATTLDRDKHSRIVQSGNKSYVPGSKDHTGLHKTYSVHHDHETPSHPGGRHLRTNDFFTESLDALIEYHESYLTHLRKIREDGGLLLSEGGDPLVRIMIKASTSEAGCCAECGSALIRIIDKKKIPDEVRNRNAGSKFDFHRRSLSSGEKLQDFLNANPPQTLGWQPSCSCRSSLPPVPATVLDCFNGAGTTGVVALALGRRYIGLDLNRGYLAMSQARIADSLRPISRYDPPRPVKPLDGQMEMFGDERSDG